MLDLFVIALLTAISIFIYNIWTPRLKGVPGPRPLPVLGNAIELWQKMPFRNKWLRESVKMYGPVFQVTVPAQPPFLLLASPELAEHVLKTNFENYPKGPPFTNRLVDLLGRGIFNVDGDGWRVQRKTASHIFTMKALRDTMSHVFVRHGGLLLSHLCTLNASTSIDIQDCFFRFTLDSIALIAFGVDLHCLDFGREVKFAQAFDEAQRIADKRFFEQTWQIKKLLGLGSEGRMSRALSTINTFATHVITERRRLSKAELSSRTDLLTQFLTMERDEDGNLFTDEYLRDIILNFIIAGRDTTAQALTWTIYEICTHPEIQEKVREEVDRVIGKATPSYENVSLLHYTHAVVSEALRLHPSVPVEIKFAVKDDKLPDGTFVPAGTAVAPLLQAQMRRREVFGPTAEEFDPERWIDRTQSDSESSSSSFKLKSFTEFEYPVFQAGPRTCLGKHMALLEIKIMLSLILQKLIVKLVPGQKIEEEIALTLPSRFGMQVTVAQRPSI